jgi:arylformamidase
MITDKELPAPLICDFLSREASRGWYSPGTEFQIGRIDLVANTGTYVDSPLHRYRQGRYVSQLPLDSLAHLEAVVARAGAGRAIGREAFRGVTVCGKTVEGHPFPARDAAEHLVEEGAALLGADIPIGEHLCNLRSVPRRGFRFSAAPLKVSGMGTFPVRAFAVVEARCSTG